MDLLKVSAALADPVRLAILDRLAAGNQETLQAYLTGLNRRLGEDRHH